MSDLTSSVKAIFVTVLLAAILLPVAFHQIFSANTTGWDSNTVTIFTLIPLIAGVAILLALLRHYEIV